ncbi:hypothetical protein MP228_011352 [Amoeboaphelidium protococcarum]|nr:hypothetical protein MP228_011352 [Amoeboaphelidium protococcarum]
MHIILLLLILLVVQFASGIPQDGSILYDIKNYRIIPSHYGQNLFLPRQFAFRLSDAVQVQGVDCKRAGYRLNEVRLQINMLILNGRQYRVVYSPIGCKQSTVYLELDQESSFAPPLDGHIRGIQTLTFFLRSDVGGYALFQTIDGRIERARYPFSLLSQQRH